MRKLYVGDMVMHSGRPVELLYRVSVCFNSWETWRCRLLFVDDTPTLDLEFDRHATYRPIHTKKAA
jgi:hypothetical protein